MSLLRDVLNSTGYLVRDGEVRYEFVPDSETFEALCRLASGRKPGKRCSSSNQPMSSIGSRC